MSRQWYFEDGHVHDVSNGNVYSEENSAWVPLGSNGESSEPYWWRKNKKYDGTSEPRSKNSKIQSLKTSIEDAEKKLQLYKSLQQDAKDAVAARKAIQEASKESSLGDWYSKIALGGLGFLALSLLSGVVYHGLLSNELLWLAVICFVLAVPMYLASKAQESRKKKEIQSSEVCLNRVSKRFEAAGCTAEVGKDDLSNKINTLENRLVKLNQELEQIGGRI